MCQCYLLIRVSRCPMAISSYDVILVLNFGLRAGVLFVPDVCTSATLQSPVDLIQGCLW